MQCTMGPELEIKAKEDGTNPSVAKENGGLSIVSKDEYLRSESNSEGFVLGMDKSIVQPLLSDGKKNAGVNFAQFTTAGGNGLVEADCQDATESSSSTSFDDTSSDTDDEANTIDGEVGLNLFGDNPSTLDINGFCDLLRIRKRRLTTHWRTFIQPLMWRCKWVELQVKKLRAQARRYDRELADENRNFHLEGVDLKSPAFPNDCPTDKVMKRKKRRRIEDTKDLTSYMSNHNLFSYFENKMHIADGSALDEDWGNQVNSTEKINASDESKVHGESLWLESGVGNNSFEESLRQIGVLQTQVSQLKCKLGKVMTENDGKFSCFDNSGLVVPSNLTSSARSPGSTPNNGDRMQVGSSNLPSQLKSLYNMGSVVMRKGEVPSHGKVSYISDVIEGTDQSLQRAAFVKAEDEILICDEKLREGMKQYDLSIPMEKHQVSMVEPESAFTDAFKEAELQTDLQPPTKMRSISMLTATKKKRKRGRRKASSGRQSHRSSG